MNTANKMFITSDMKISDVIIMNPYMILMLEHFGIDMEVHEKTIENICTENNLNPELFQIIANLINGFQPKKVTDYSYNDIQTIIAYLKNSHHYYLDEKYPEIQNQISAIYRLNDNSEIIMIGEFFNDYFKEVVEHLNYEDDIVFPYVLGLNERLILKGQVPIPGNYSVTEYREHHNDIEEKLMDLNNLLIKYIPQRNDRRERRLLIFSLFELEYDLKIHSMIEETILIPMVEKMELLAGKVND
jgi:regulator of cell morphogenesis and NO signaling